MARSLAGVVAETEADKKLVPCGGSGRFRKQSRLSQVGHSVTGNTKARPEESSVSWVVGQ